MNKLLLSLFIILLFSTTLQADPFTASMQKTESKIFNIKEIKKINIINKFGNVDIKTWKEDKISYSAKITARAKRESNAANLLDDISIVTNEIKDNITIKTQIKRSKITNISFEILLEIHIPEYLDVNVNTFFGDISIFGNTGLVNLKNDNGNILAKDINQAVISNKFGTIEVYNIVDNLNINNTDGDIIVKDAAGTVQINTKFSDINIKNISDSLNITSNDGNIEVYNFHNAKISNSYGDVKLINQDGNLELSVRDGNIDANDITGKVNIFNIFGGITLNKVKGAVTINAKDSDIMASDIANNLYI